MMSTGVPPLPALRVACCCTSGRRSSSFQVVDVCDLRLCDSPPLLRCVHGTCVEPPDSCRCRHLCLLLHLLGRTPLHTLHLLPGVMILTQRTCACVPQSRSAGFVRSFVSVRFLCVSSFRFYSSVVNMTTINNDNFNNMCVHPGTGQPRAGWLGPCGEGTWTTEVAGHCQVSTLTRCRAPAAAMSRHPPTRCGISMHHTATTRRRACFTCRSLRVKAQARQLPSRRTATAPTVWRHRMPASSTTPCLLTS